jgi:homocysteine S-methyltransferase
LAQAKFLTWIEEADRPLLADGAMGTMLHARGVPFAMCFDALNLSDPKRVADIHRAYIEAGSQLILTNTFGANRYKLAEHGLASQVSEINRAGVALARRVVEASFKDVLIGGDVGPLGVRLVPYGRVQQDQARDVFAEQIAALAEAGVDFLLIETVSDLNEILQAAHAARDVCALPLVASMTFTRDDRTLLGDSPTQVARSLWEAEFDNARGVDMLGVNCSGGPAQLLRILQEMHTAVPQARFWVKPNAGWPEQVGGRIMYPATPEYFGDYAMAFMEAGARVIGGCCGTTPAHIAAMRRVLDSGAPSHGILEQADSAGGSEEPTPPSDQPTAMAQKLIDGHFVIAAEMDPPRGLSTHKLLAGASLLEESGADVINVADSPMARMRMSPWAVCNLIQRRVGVETTLHFPTRGRNLLRVQGDLLAAHALGIRNVFVVMGDPTSIGDYPDALDDYDVVPSGLIKLIKRGFNVGVDHSGSDIGQPTAFFVGGALNLSPQDPEREIKVLRRKIRGGVDFLLTQPVYDAEAAYEFVAHYEAAYGKLEVPVLVGILPLYSARHAAFLHNEVPGITIPDGLHERLANADDKAKYEGVDIALEIIAQMRELGDTSRWVAGIYLMPAFNRYDLAAEIVEACQAM